MKTRIITAALLLPAFLLIVLLLPSVFTAILFGLMTAVAAYELLWGTNFLKHPRLIAYAAVMAFLVSVWSGFGAGYVWALLGVLVLILVLFAEIMISDLKLPFDKVILCAAAGLLIPFLLTALVRIRSASYGRFFIMIPIIVAFISDSGAYFAGFYLGKHKLAPNISPKKTIEGAIGGIVAAVIGLVIYGLVLQLAFGFQVNYIAAIVYGVVGSIAGVFGDLCFSAIKRQTGIKDYGNLMPGHGGILDRFDSMVIIAPLMEVLLILLPMAVKLS